MTSLSPLGPSTTQGSHFPLPNPSHPIPSCFLFPFHPVFPLLTRLLELRNYL